METGTKYVLLCFLFQLNWTIFFGFPFSHVMAIGLVCITKKNIGE